MKTPQSFVIIDTETTGFLPAGRACEVACVRVHEGEIVDRWSRLVKPPIPIGEGAARIHGITEAMVAAESPYEGIHMLLEEMADAGVVTGWNVIDFDVPLLKAHYDDLVKAGHPRLALKDRPKPVVLDFGMVFKAMQMADYGKAERKAAFPVDGETLSAYQRRIADFRTGLKWKLDVAAEQHKVNNEDRELHRALGDCDLALEVWRAMVATGRVEKLMDRLQEG